MRGVSGQGLGVAARANETETGGTVDQPIVKVSGTFAPVDVAIVN